MEILIQKLIAQLKQINERLGRIEERFDEFENAYSFKTYKVYVPGSKYSYADDDVLLDEAIKLVVETGTASVSFLQRRMKMEYARAARILDIMEEKGIVGPSRGAKPRDILVDEYTEKDNGEK